MKSLFLLLSTFLFSPFYHSFQANGAKGEATLANPTQKMADFSISVGTLESSVSPAGKLLKTWAQAVNQKSNGKMEIKLFFNGQQGEEGAMIGKIKTGQLSGALVSEVGLSKVYKPMCAMSMPGLFTDVNKFTAALLEMKPEFDKGATDAGFTPLGYFYAGKIRFMSKGSAIKLPTDLPLMKMYKNQNDNNMVALYSVVGATSAVPLGTPDVLPNLNTGTINAIYSTSTFAEQAQWAAKCNNICEDIAGIRMGGLIISSKIIEQLPPDMKDILFDTSKIMISGLLKKLNAEDEDAFTRLKGKMTLVKYAAEDKEKWEATFLQTRQKLAQGTYSPDLVSKLEGLAK